MRGRVLAVAVATTALAGCGTAGSKPSSPQRTTATAATAAPAAPTAACVVGAQSPPSSPIDATFATALAFAPDGRLFFAERAGTVRVVQDGTPRVFATVRTVTTEAGGGYSERGLLGLAISPRFATDHYVYAFYSEADRVHQAVVRWRDCAGSGTGRKTIVQLPAGADCCHKGGRLAFGPDGRLYVTLGEEHTADAAQHTSDVRGKILRYNADGTIPKDNPFGASNPVWAFGFRNPFGLAFSARGQMAVTSNGPTGDAGSPSTGYDLMFASVARGAGYQWPKCYGYSHPIAPNTSCGNQSEPDWSSENSTVVPTGATFVDDTGPHAVAGHLVFCTFGDGMNVVTPGTPHATVSPGPSECRLDVKQGPDHALYYSDDHRIYRLG
jgi:glucose/arabinose dehydrogenase